MRIIIFLSLLLSFSPAVQSQINFESKHFTIEKLADGVFAVIAKSSGYAISNSGIIDLGGKTIVFDAFICPEAAEDLKKAAMELTGNKIIYLVNSHYHDDHVGGNQAFEGGTIISSKKTAELMKKILPEETRDVAEKAKKNLEILYKIDKSLLSDFEKEEHIKWVAYFEAMRSASSNLKITYPNKTFEDKLIIGGKKRSVQLVSFGEGHTPGDLFLYIPDEKIAFLGDLLFVQYQPWLGDGDAKNWKTYLDSIALMHISIVVPGHGPVGTKADFEPLRNYIDTVMATAQAYFKEGKSPSDDPSLKTPSPFDHWYLSKFFAPNVIMAFNKKKGQVGK